MAATDTKDPSFDPSAGRDYTQDAVAVDDQGRERTPTPDSSAAQGEKSLEAVPKAKSPAQVAAEKAEAWKRQQLAEEEAKKNKTHIRRKLHHQMSFMGDPQKKNNEKIEFSLLEQEL